MRCALKISSPTLSFDSALVKLNLMNMDAIFLLIALVVCIPIHEASHAWTAYKLGDPTAKDAGRVTLNPFAHLDLLGTLMIFIARFGWGKPTPFNYHNLKHPRRDAALIAIAGPISNLLTAFVIAILIKYIGQMPEFVFRALSTIFDLSLILFLFNLLPIAPLDGSKLIGLIVPHSKEDWYIKFLSQGPLILILLVVFDRLLASVSGFSFFGIFFNYGYNLTKSIIFLAT